MSTYEHYENHLADFYSWIYGGQENKIRENSSFFLTQGIKPHLGGTAVDLGAGSGFQSIPLASAGFKVYAVDFSKKLLDELKSSAGSSGIKIINSGIMNFSSYMNLSPELIVCMGDTLTHLESISDVKLLLENCYSELVKGGILILTFRDLTRELAGKDRFIPVMSSPDKIFTCFLEYFPGHVNVYDIVNLRAGDAWEQKISSYKKIKIPPGEIKKYLEATGFSMKFFNADRGLVSVIAEKA